MTDDQLHRSCALARRKNRLLPWTTTQIPPTPDGPVFRSLLRQIAQFAVPYDNDTGFLVQAWILMPLATMQAIERECQSGFVYSGEVLYDSLFVSVLDPEETLSDAIDPTDDFGVIDVRQWAADLARIN